MIHFIYLAHSKDRYRKQAVFSILSLLNALQNSALGYRITVYTDLPGFFKPLEVETVIVDQEKITQWTEKTDYIHRAKLCLAIDAASRLKGKIVTLDSDNYFFADPTSVLSSWNDDTVFMERLEYLLGKPADLVGKKYKHFFKNNTTLGDQTCSYEVTMKQECWNSGVLGLPQTSFHFLPHALSVCDDLHTRFRKHISEQLATSIVMSKHFKIEPFKPFTYHWFGHGQAINHIIDEVLSDYPDQGLSELVDRVSRVKERVLNAPLNPDKQPWHKRWFSA